MREIYKKEIDGTKHIVEYDEDAHEIKSENPWLFSVFIKYDSFDEQIASLNPTKPIMLTETAVTENPYDENAKKVWLSGMFADIKSRSRIKGISYWNESWGTKTNIGTSPVSLKSFSDGIKSPVFINQPNISFVGD